MRIFILVIGALFWAVPGVAQTPVYVFTQVAEFVDEDSKQREDTVEDLRKALSKKKALVVVDTEDDAQIVLEVLDRGQESTGGRLESSNRNPIGGVWSLSQELTTGAVVVSLTVGSYTTELTAENDQAFGEWTAMANDIAKQVENWAKDNAAALAGER